LQSVASILDCSKLIESICTVYQFLEIVSSFHAHHAANFGKKNLA
jgi:hypothetical protein